MGPILIGTLSGCLGAFMPPDRGISFIQAGMPLNLQVGFAAFGVCLFVCCVGREESLVMAVGWAHVGGLHTLNPTQPHTTTLTTPPTNTHTTNQPTPHTKSTRISQHQHQPQTTLLACAFYHLAANDPGLIGAYLRGLPLLNLSDPENLKARERFVVCDLEWVID